MRTANLATATTESFLSVATFDFEMEEADCLPRENFFARHAQQKQQRTIFDEQILNSSSPPYTQAQTQTPRHQNLTGTGGPPLPPSPTFPRPTHLNHRYKNRVVRLADPDVSVVLPEPFQRHGERRAGRGRALSSLAGTTYEELAEVVLNLVGRSIDVTGRTGQLLLLLLHTSVFLRPKGYSSLLLQ